MSARMLSTSSSSDASRSSSALPTSEISSATASTGTTPVVGASTLFSFMVGGVDLGAQLATNNAAINTIDNTIPAFFNIYHQYLFIFNFLIGVIIRQRSYSSSSSSSLPSSSSSSSSSSVSSSSAPSNST